MTGSTPALKNVIPMRADESVAEKAREKARKRAQRKLIKKLRPKGLPADVDAEYGVVAEILSAPCLDRLRPEFMHAIREFCFLTVRLRSLRATMPTLGHEVYRIEGRNGLQVKSHPHLGQINETWRQWRSLLAALGMTPADAQTLMPGGQGELFSGGEHDSYFD